ncbi:cell division protein ZapD [Celerinatantimonas sp. YJH-8]|uniref:cell division protein ZapD n=1 Tax=Celerinatantimonas sp. YJH-8 TaxID=3228714 RepID=UPI0038C7E72D
MQNKLIFEHPLNEKVRTYLRVENLFDTLEQTTKMQDASQVQNFFRTLFDLNEVLDRSEWRSDLLKDLDKQRQRLRQWANLPQTDTSKVQEALTKANQLFSKINQQPKLSNLIKEDRFLNMLRQRLALPGGACSFDLPQLYYWYHLNEVQRDVDLLRWLTPFMEVASAMGFILSMLRGQSLQEYVVAKGGFYQGQREGCALLRLEISSEVPCFPTISGHKNRFAIKFMTLDGAIQNDLNFSLTCCRSI